MLDPKLEDKVCIVTLINGNSYELHESAYNAIAFRNLSDFTEVKSTCGNNVSIKSSSVAMIELCTYQEMKDAFKRKQEVDKLVYNKD